MRANRLFSYALLFFELVVLSAGFAAALYLRYDELRIDNDLYYNYYLQLFFFMNASWLLTTALFNRHHLVPTDKISTTLNKLSRGFLMEVALMGVFIFMMKGDYSRLFFVFLASIAVPAMYALRIFWVFWYRTYLKNPKRGRNILLVGSNATAVAFEHEITLHPEFGYRLTKKLSAETPLHEITNVATAFKVDELFVALPPEAPTVAALFLWAEENLVRFRFLPDLGPRFLRSAAWDVIGELPVLKARKEPLSLLHNRILKRTFDVVFSATALVVLTPILLPIVAMAIKGFDRGPIFFKQQRSGLNNKPFTCWKFRTMQINNPTPDLQAQPRDPRITPIGRVLRRHNIDELPQFINVLFGDMSIVGPRPHMLAHTENYRQRIQAFMVRHYITPGLTGLAQVRGFRGPTPQDTDMAQRIENDVYYLENWSLFLDIKIILKTIWLTVKGQDNAW